MIMMKRIKRAAHAILMVTHHSFSSKLHLPMILSLECVKGAGLAGAGPIGTHPFG